MGGVPGGRGGSKLLQNISLSIGRVAMLALTDPPLPLPGRGQWDCFAKDFSDPELRFPSSPRSAWECPPALRAPQGGLMPPPQHPGIFPAVKQSACRRNRVSSAGRQRTGATSPETRFLIPGLRHQTLIFAKSLPKSRSRTCRLT